MGRTFLVLSLANVSLREPARKEACLEVMDRIIEETIRLEASESMYHFLMPYARWRPWVLKPARSQFLDGEIALMLAARRMVADKPEYRDPLHERVDAMVARMEQSPVLCAESYPDECWMFCNVVALAAIRMTDRLDGTDHAAFINRWMATAKARLVHKETGLLVSCFDFRGGVGDGPEGSSIWTVAHFLQAIDPAFAADQYARARKELGDSLLGFGYAREWPDSWVGRMDIDSGPIVPILDISAGSSGQAILGAATFGDREFFARLTASLNFGGFPKTDRGALRYCASNQVGDSVILYAATQGPLWERVRGEM
jgi:hypothetical protein